MSGWGLALERWVFRQGAWAFATIIAILATLAMAGLAAGWSWRQQAEEVVAGTPGIGAPGNAPTAAQAPLLPSSPQSDARPTLAPERVLNLAREAAARSQVLLLSTTMGTVPDNSSGGVVPELTAELQGAYPAIKQWLVALQDQEPTLYVSHLNLRAPSGQDMAGARGQVRLRWEAAPLLQRQGTGS